MYMRLGFSVAVHVDPEVLLVDEVLAVGDEGSRTSASTSSRISNAAARPSCS
jgi:ABC-type polysaccharide/polyol phosphate transport system ATPase subunit